MLGNSADAHDAFQTTFLVLIRRAGSIRQRNSVQSWLFAVARKVAAQMKIDEADAGGFERRAAPPRAINSRHGEAKSYA